MDPSDEATAGGGGREAGPNRDADEAPGPGAAAGPVDDDPADNRPTDSDPPDDVPARDAPAHDDPADNGPTVAGIGASAGGLESMRALLEAMPDAPGLALVYVSHLDPAHESHVAESLARATDLPVEQARDGTPVEANHVYVLPSNASMTLEDGVLRLHPRSPHDEPPDVIDRFLVSLAADLGSRSIGVLLSGALSDGTRGLREIRAAGGFTLAQDPRTASYRSMPETAIQAGYADRVLAPAEIADELVRLTARIDRAPPGPPPGLPEPDEAAMEEIFDLVRDAVGVDFAAYKKTTLKRRLHRRMLALGTDDVAEYVEALRDDPAEVRRLYDEFLIQVTGFFRDPETFEAVEQKVLPRLLEDRHSEDPLRVWVPGCATGEEAYSIAMLLTEHLDRAGETTPVQIFATDVSEAAIAKAREGQYSEAIRGDLSPDRLQRFFVETENGYRVSKRIRGQCVFAVQDVTRDPPFSNMDLVSCRNLLIYLEPSLQKRVVAAVHYALKPDGLLCVGASESLDRFDHLFERIDSDRRIYRPRDVAAQPYHDLLGGRAGMPAADPTGGGPPHTPRRVWSDDQVRQEADRRLLERFAPPAVVVNRDLEVIEFRGETAPFLQHGTGEPTLNVLRMARKGLAVELNSAITEVRKTDEPAHRRAVRVQQPEGPGRTVDLEVVPFHSPGSDAPNYIVLFREDGRGEAGTGAERSADRLEDRTAGPSGTGRDRPGLLDRLLDREGPELAEPDADERVRQLEQELESTQEYLQSVIEEYEATTEELRSANEEALSTNEELQSTNEELQTAKEELQSTNEELKTLNDELQERNREVQEVNSDLINLLHSVDIPIVMLGEDLRIRRFTPTAEEELNLIPTDVGRPLTDLRLPLDVGDLEARILEVLKSLQSEEVQVAAEEGGRWTLSIHPYRTADNRIEGAVLVMLPPDRAGPSGAAGEGQPPGEG